MSIAVQFKTNIKSPVGGVLSVAKTIESKNQEPRSGVMSVE